MPFKGSPRVQWTVRAKAPKALPCWGYLLRALCPGWTGPALPHPLLSLPECGPGLDVRGPHKAVRDPCKRPGSDGRMVTAQRLRVSTHRLYRCLRARRQPGVRRPRLPRAPHQHLQPGFRQRGPPAVRWPSPQVRTGSHSARACLLAGTPAGAFTCPRCPCAPD